jgi:hypothetical protein
LALPRFLKLQKWINSALHTALCTVSKTNLENLEACLKKSNLKQAERHLAIAKWNGRKPRER